MPLFLGVWFFIFSAVPALAQVPIVRDTPVPYDIFVVEGDPEVRQTFLGILGSYPDMYEIASDRDFTLALALSQYSPHATPTAFSLIVVSENDRGRGVTEVIRLNPSSQDGWVDRYDRQLAMTFYSAERVHLPLPPGIYRFEVSTPDNTGSYLLEFGTAPASGGFMTTFDRVRTVRDFFGLSEWGIVRATIVFYPLIAVIVVGLVIVAWRYRHRIQHELR